MSDGYFDHSFPRKTNNKNFQIFQKNPILGAISALFCPTLGKNGFWRQKGSASF